MMDTKLYISKGLSKVTESRHDYSKSESNFLSMEQVCTWPGTWEGWLTFQELWAQLARCLCQFHLYKFGLQTSFIGLYGFSPLTLEEEEDTSVIAAIRN